MDYTIDTLKVQLYSTTGGKVRLVLEVVLFLAICANIVIELRGWAITTKRKVSVKPASAGLPGACMRSAATQLQLSVMCKEHDVQAAPAGLMVGAQVAGLGRAAWLAWHDIMHH